MSDIRGLGHRLMHQPKQPIKKCLIIRAMQPERFPQAYDTLVRKLKKNATRGGSRVEPCRCAPPCGKFTALALRGVENTQGIILRPTKEQVDALTDKVAQSGDAVLMQEFRSLFNVPDQPNV